MPHYQDEAHLVGSRSRSRRSAYSVSSDEFEEVVSGGASPIPADRRRRDRDDVVDKAGVSAHYAHMPASAVLPQVMDIDVPFGYHTATSEPADGVSTIPVAVYSKDNRQKANVSSRAHYPRQVDITAPPGTARRRSGEHHRTPSPTASSSSGSMVVDACGREDSPPPPPLVPSHRSGRRGEPAGMFDVLATEHNAWGQAASQARPPPPAPRDGNSTSACPYPMPSPNTISSAAAAAAGRDAAPQPEVLAASADAAFQEYVNERLSSPPSAVPQPVLFYTSPFFALDYDYTHEAAPHQPQQQQTTHADSEAVVSAVSPSPAPHTVSDAAAWAVSGCGGAVANQFCVCLMSSVCGCCTLPCLVAKERHALLFNDTEGRYVCCAGIMPCCIPAQSVRPELYVTIAPPQPRALQGKYGIYPQRSMPTSRRGDAAVENVVDKINGLPQFGCYHRTERPHRRPSSRDRRGRAYADNDMATAAEAADPRATPALPPGATSCCFGCCVIDRANNMCVLNCAQGGCPRCPSPTACCVRCPLCCLACEVCCCAPCAVMGNRMLIRQHYGLKPDLCLDTPAIGCYSCLRTCLLCASPPLASRDSGGGGGGGANIGRLIGCCGSPDPTTCCAECAYSLATACAACCCLSPCVSCAMAQHRDQVERLGYPLLSVFSPPDISGMS